MSRDPPAELWLAAHAAAADRHTMDVVGIPGGVSMERAALACARVIERAFPSDGVVHCLCGPGNNGADGVALARILHARGRAVRVLLATERGGAARDAQLRVAVGLGVPVERLSDVACIVESTRDVVVDALLGTGASGAPRGAIADALGELQDLAAGRLALDVPSGVDPDTGHMDPRAFRADWTVTFERSKPGLHVTPGRDRAGHVVVARIGLVPPPSVASVLELVLPGRVRAALAALPPGRHKGERGHVGVVGGSPGTAGALVLAGTAALRAGAGLVTLVSSDPEVTGLLVRERPELMTDPGDQPRVAGRATALVVGPGWTQASRSEALRGLWSEDPRPAVWDAGAFAGLPEGIPPAGPRILTPHPGEAATLLARLSGRPVSRDDVQADRIAVARELAALTGAIVTLKGEGSLVARPDGHVAIACTGGPVLATAGTGDCLAGLAGALLARGLDPFAAACCAVHVHGLAGDRLARERPVGWTAADVADALADALGVVGESAGGPEVLWA